MLSADILDEWTGIFIHTHTCVCVCLQPQAAICMYALPPSPPDMLFPGESLSGFRQRLTEEVTS